MTILFKVGSRDILHKRNLFLLKVLDFYLLTNTLKDKNNLLTSANSRLLSQIPMEKEESKTQEEKERYYLINRILEDEDCLRNYNKIINICNITFTS